MYVRCRGSHALGQVALFSFFALFCVVAASGLVGGKTSKVTTPGFVMCTLHSTTIHALHLASGTGIALLALLEIYIRSNFLGYSRAGAPWGPVCVLGF